MGADARGMLLGTDCDEPMVKRGIPSCTDYKELGKAKRESWNHEIIAG